MEGKETESSEVVGVVSGSAGAFVGAAVVVGKKMIGFLAGGMTTAGDFLSRFAGEPSQAAEEEGRHSRKGRGS